MAKGTEFSRYVRLSARNLGRTEASVRSKLRTMGVRASDTPKQRIDKILKYMDK